MNEFLKYQLGLPLGWGDLAIAAVVLAGLYWLLKLLYWSLEKLPGFADFKTAIKHPLNVGIVLLQPVALIILLTIFIFINPLLHGIIAGLILIASFLHLKNYLSGRLILLDEKIRPGVRFSNGEVSGTIVHCGHLSIHIGNQDGIFHLPYYNLLTTGYSITTEKITDIQCKIRLSRQSEGKVVVPMQQLLFRIPYIDWSKPVEWNQDKNAWSLQCSLYSKNHLREMVDLLAENGYETSILNQ
ncbi:MAG: hypothetical protein KatS3mg030_395 [Saprospiraceae bacterium]|nr:MAG: hypothetical protein KatS3mg030_395 [Saprospiraceae bacterium]